MLNNEDFWDEIVSIEEVGEIETIDISVSGDQLFFANDILTHNSAYGASDVDLTNTSESMGMVHTVDSAFAIMTSEELAENNKVIIKQLKNRWGDTNHYNKFVVGMNKARMMLFNVEESAQRDLNMMKQNKYEDKPIMDEKYGDDDLIGSSTFKFGSPGKKFLKV